MRWTILAPALVSALLGAPASAQTVTGLTIEGDVALGTEDAQVRYFNAAGCVCEREVEVGFTLSSLGTEGDLVVLVGTGCVDSGGDLDSSCQVLLEGRLETSAAVRTLVTDVRALLGDSCAEDEGTRTIFVAADVDDQGVYATLASLAFAFDTDLPDAPVGEDVLPGEALAEVVFSVDEDSEAETLGVEYQVLCWASGEAVFESPPQADFLSAEDLCGAVGDVREDYVCSKASSAASSVTVLGLENGVEYDFAVVAVDAAGNPSALTEVGSTTPAPEVDLLELYKQSGGAADGGHCFVATAAYGDYDDPQVRTLRAFRDRVLKKSAVGRAFVRAYYASSPPIAHIIAKQDILRRATRAGLTPLVWFAAWILEDAR